MIYAKLFLISQSQEISETFWSTSQLQILEGEPQGQAGMPIASPKAIELYDHFGKEEALFQSRNMRKWCRDWIDVTESLTLILFSF